MPPDDATEGRRVGFALPHPPHSVLFGAARRVAASAPRHVAARFRTRHVASAHGHRRAVSGAMMRTWGRTRCVRIASFHVNINCSDLERSLAFYCDGIGLHKGTRTKPEAPQPGGASGSQKCSGTPGSCTATRATGRRARSARMAGSAPARQAAPARHRRRLQPSLHPCARSRRHPCSTRGDGRRLLDRADGVGSRSADRDVHRERSRRDPDRVARRPAVQLSHVAINCTDIERSQRFYEDVMGLANGARHRVASPAGHGVPPRRRRAAACTPHARHDDGVHGRTDLVDQAVGHELGLPLRQRSRHLPHGLAHQRHRPRLPRPPARRHLLLHASRPRSRWDPALASLRALFFDDPDAVCLELIESGAR